MAAQRIQAHEPNHMLFDSADVTRHSDRYLFPCPNKRYSAAALAVRLNFQSQIRIVINRDNHRKEDPVRWLRKLQ
jgi:hypothetical protein